MTVAAHLGLLRQAITTTGATFPKPVSDALADHATLTGAVADISPATSDQIAEAVAAAILDGRDPLADEQVRRLTTSQSLGGDTGRGLAYSVQLAGERRIVAAIDTHTDKILATLCQAANQTGQRLTAAHIIIGDYDLADHTNIIRRGDDASRAWNDASAALKALRTIDSGWVALAELTRFAKTTEPTLRLAALTLDQYEHLGRKSDPWTLVRAGITIDMADRTTIRERTDRITQAREQRQARQASSFSDEYRRTRGDGRVAAS